MTLKVFLFLLLILIGGTVKSQTFLNADSAQIKKTILLKGGVLTRSYFENGFEVPGRYRKMEFRFPKLTYENGLVSNMTFYMTLKNKCFMYEMNYRNSDCVSKLKDKFNKTSSGLNQIQDSLKWIDNFKKYEIKMSPMYDASKTIVGCLLEIRNINRKVN